MNNPVTDITAKQLEEMLAQGNKITVVDVRFPRDFARGHIPDAINIPVPWKKRPANLSAEGDVAVVCYFGGYNRNCSKELAKERKGVLRLKGGMSAWQGDLVSDLIVPGWSADRYVRIIYGGMVLLSTLGTAILNPWIGLLTFAAGIFLVIGGIFDRCPVLNFFRGSGYK
ncbi:rhodanese-like domain-containing protein [Syntrophomonas curvata]